ncbi:hypothetical protein M408DRAFT_330550 [Serendipita vermifera MAFF 305830]|uniref:F-box domain-containing protein n=1 Tax=Serendipita vermifera MAFF 305830 TaxID=933852 RepID=A0A0C3B595_SERVB|nr:hypothetical protein M408DRAFT_330550 [Serendipita vermifera MAFF 305830]
MYCHEIDTLARFVNRTGTATFDFRIGCPSYGDPSKKDIQQFTSSVPQNWLSRCHSFSLYAPEEGWRTPKTTTLGDLLGTYSYEALERLELIHTGTKMWEHMLETLMSRIESTSLGLRSLKIDCGLETDHVVKCVLERPAVLRRLRCLEIRDLKRSIPWTELPELEELWFHEMEDSDRFLEALDSRKLRKLTLGGDFMSLPLPQKICQQLTHLTLELLDLKDPIHVEPLKLPSLVYLGLKVTQFFLSLIEAPKLEELVFQFDPFDENPYVYPDFEDTAITPRVIRLDVLKDVLADEGEHDQFSLELGIWSKVEELHLTTFESKDDIGSTLTDALSGSASQRSFPSLRTFTVLHPEDKDGNITQETTKSEQVKNLQKIAENRRDAGCKDLERLEVGWYSTNGKDYTLEDQSRAWWVIKWENCLK